MLPHETDGGMLRHTQEMTDLMSHHAPQQGGLVDPEPRRGDGDAVLEDRRQRALSRTSINMGMSQDQPVPGRRQPFDEPQRQIWPLERAVALLVPHPMITCATEDPDHLKASAAQNALGPGACSRDSDRLDA